MNKKAKAYLSVAVIILILYLATVGIFFNIVKNSVISDFNDEMLDIQTQICTDEYSDYNIDANNLAYDFSDLSTYPYRAVIYDEDFNEVARTGSYILFSHQEYNRDKNSNYCFIDKYLTSDIVEQIFENESKGYYLGSFSYAVEDDEVIPVEIAYKNNQAILQEPIVITNETPDYTSIVPTDYVDIDLGYNYEKYIFNDLETIDNEISSINANSDYTAYEYGDYDYNDCDFYSWIPQIIANGQEYNVLLVGRISPNQYTLHHYNFIRYAEILTAIYVAFAVIAFTCVYFIIKKSQIEKAKYAFTNAAAHELKTPLAVIENQCEFILEGVNEEKNDEYIKSIYSQTLRMSQLLNSLLKYNKLKSTDKIEKEQTSLTDIVKAEILKFEGLADTKGIKLTANLEELVINCNYELISLVVDNFLSNAIKFSKEGSEVIVKIEGNKFSVTNAFTGTLPKNIWDILYTNDKSRNDKSTGMGLPISKEILVLHKFKYGFNTNENEVEFYFTVK